MSDKQYDVIIVGAGIVGLTLVNLLKDSGLRCAVLEKNQILTEYDSAQPDTQVVALNHFSQRVFEQLGVWSTIKELGVSPYYDMHVWDRKSKSDIHFSATDIGKENLGHIIEKRVLLKALVEAVSFPGLSGESSRLEEPIIKTNIRKIRYVSSSVVLECDNGTYNTKLLIGADGANSFVREQLHFNLKKQSYQQMAFVGTVQTEKPHDRTAWQVFLPDGTLAFLPLKDAHTASFVWALRNSCAEKLAEKDKASFSGSLSRASQEKLGKITLQSEFLSYPLMERHSDVYVKNHVVLVGDAAHTIHPLAGQGLNLGIKDAKVLSEVLLEAIRNHRDFSAAHTLRKYQRARRADNLITQKAMMGFKQLFTNNSSLVVQLRGLGLNFVDNCSVLKNKFIRHALG